MATYTPEQIMEIEMLSKKYNQSKMRNAQHKKVHYKRLSFCFHKTNDADIIDYIKNDPQGIVGCIRRLIRDDIASRNGGD